LHVNQKRKDVQVGNIFNQLLHIFTGEILQSSWNKESFFPSPSHLEGASCWGNAYQ